MKIRFFTHLFLLCSLLSSVFAMPAVQAAAYHTEHVRVAEPTSSSNLFFIGAAVVAVTGFFVWLFSSPSDEKVFNDAQDACDTIAHRYGRVMGYLSRVYPDCERDHIDRVSEHVLEELATTYEVHAGSHFSMHDAAKKVEKERAKLEKRIKRLISKEENVDLCQQMQALSREMQGVLDKLNFARLYVKEHDAYFKAREGFLALSNKYQDVYKAALHCQGKDLQEKMHVLVMNYGQRYNDSYPYVAYVDTLVAAIDAMRSQMNPRYFAHDYPVLMKDAHEIMQTLEQAKDALLVGDTYSKQKREKERAAREAERLELERRQAQALEAQAAAQAAQAEACFVSAVAQVANACRDDDHHHDSCHYYHGGHCSCGHHHCG